MIPAIDNIPANSNTATVQNPKASLGKDDFLKLLIAQLQAQDPLSPMDAQDFSAQLAQFSALEQMTNVNTNLEKIQQLETSLANASAINLIGKTVDAPGNTVNHQAGRSNTLSYTLEGDASLIQVGIFDSIGSRVASLGFRDQAAGTNSVVWNGLDSSGNPLKEGTYTFRIDAQDEEGNVINSRTLTEGRVTEVVFDSGQSFAVVNGEKLPVSEISRIGL